MNIVIRRRLVLLVAAMLLTACGSNYFIKQQTAEFSKAAGEAINLVTALPQRIKTAEANVQRTLMTLDPNCEPVDGKIIVAHTKFLFEGENLKAMVPNSLCRDAVLTIQQCRTGKDCFRCAPTDKSCLQAQSMARASDTCFSPDVVKRLPSACADELWTTAQFPTPKESDAARAYQATVDLAATALEFVNALSKLSLDQEKPAVAHVKQAIDDLKSVTERANAILGAGTITFEEDDSVKAYASLASLLVEWSNVADDARKIRERIARDGEQFRQNLKDIGIAANFLQKVYLRALTETDAASLRARYATKSAALSEIERDWWMRAIADADSRASFVKSETPIADVLNAVCDAQTELARIASGNFSEEERAEIARINLKQFGRLISRLKTIYSLI